MLGGFADFVSVNFQFYFLASIFQISSVTNTFIKNPKICQTYFAASKIKTKVLMLLCLHLDIYNI